MKKTAPAGIVRSFAIALWVSAGVFCWAGVAAPSESDGGSVVARVNGKPVRWDAVLEKIEQLYPSSSAHGRPGGSVELRQKAMDEVVLEELIWQEAVKGGRAVPLADAQGEMLRLRRRYGARAFDADLRQSGVSRAQFAKKLQRTMTIQRARKEHVELPARVGPQAVRAYYDSNQDRFRRPERARFRLILVAVEPKASKEAEQQAKKKAEDFHAQLKAGKDFGELAYESSDDIYRVKGGDVGWMHKGSMDPEFEPLALSLPIGQFTAPFRTPLGYSILKVEAREPAKKMSFAEMRDKLRLQLTTQNSKRLHQAWEAELKKKAHIEILDQNVGMQPLGTQRMEAMPAH